MTLHQLIKLFAFLSAFLNFCYNVEGDDPPCICKNKSLCAALTVGPRQEVYGFSTQTENWKHWDWNKLTTVSLFGKWDEELLCFAHEKVRILLLCWQCILA